MAEQIEKQRVKVAEAKGRPMLHWVGKKPLDSVTVFPTQLVETFNPTGEENEAQGLVFHGDNKDAMAWLLAHGYRRKVKLIYIDPPFDSGADYVRRVQLRGIRTAELEGEAHSLDEQIQYTDIWANDMYLQFIYERLLMMKELLSDTGSIYVHLDYRMDSYIRVIMDEVFGQHNYRNELIWAYEGREMSEAQYNRKHDTILFYSKGQDITFNYDDILDPLKESSRQAMSRYQDEDGKYFILRYKDGGGFAPLDQEGENTYRQYVPEGVPPRDWFMIDYSRKSERTGFPTQKPRALLERFIKASSNRGELVADFFIGCGTTAEVAQQLGRRWIGCDINRGAIQTTSKQLQKVITNQMESKPTPPPAALSFSVYRVNDYDLQIQHNEAVNLVVEHIGIERTRTDPFFDGTLGKRLVKIVPFNHPLTLLDLQLLQDELKARPDEDRNMVVVCLGKESAVDPELEKYNKHRAINKIEVIELRTHQKYGKFFVHQPVHAEVNIERRNKKIMVEIEDFISPTIVERLEMDTPLFKVEIPDWRAMVDVVLIDTSYDGEVFDITLSDVPEKKDNLVQGRYELPAPGEETTVAVKIIDMLGEEVITTARV